MLNSLAKIYQKEIYPYRKKDNALKIAIAVNVVDNYFDYDQTYTGNLARALKRKKGLCADYSFMLDYFLRKMGYQTKIVGIWEQFGFRERFDYHALVAVKIRKKWFYIDPTNMDVGKYGVFRKGDNIWFNASLNWLTFPGWKLRGIY